MEAEEVEAGTMRVEGEDTGTDSTGIDAVEVIEDKGGSETQEPSAEDGIVDKGRKSEGVREEVETEWELEGTKLE